jgi:hypothetical protein
MRGRGQGFVAVVVVALVIAGGLAAERLGAAPPPDGPAPTARSGEWLCPHGGGGDWTAEIVVANPGPTPVQARFTPIAPEGPKAAPTSIEVPAGTTVHQAVPADHPASATYVEIFGGWAAASWLLSAAAPANGLGAEACAPSGGDRWTTVESTTAEGERASLVVMNPYASGAVFDVTLLQSDEPPLRDPDWASLELRAGRSIALPIHQKVVGEDVVAAIVEVRTGRVGVATLGITDGGGVRSAIGATSESSTWSVGTALGTGQSSLLVLAPGEQAVRLSGVLRSQRAPQSAGGLVDVRQSSLSTQAYPITSDGPSVIEVRAADDAPIVMALRAEGESDDDAATTGLSAPASAWVIGPTVAGEPSRSTLVVANPGEEPADVTFVPLGADGPGPPVTVTVAAGGTARAGQALEGVSPDAAFLVTSSIPVVSFGVSTSGGNFGLSRYAIVGGAPLPDWAIATLPAA